MTQNPTHLARRLTSPMRVASRSTTAKVTRTVGTGLLLLFPEIAVGLLLFDAMKAAQLHRMGDDDPERGDAIQWVVITALGAAIAVTVGAIIFNKLENKANDIDVTTPGAR